MIFKPPDLVKVEGIWGEGRTRTLLAKYGRGAILLQGDHALERKVTDHNTILKSPGVHNLTATISLEDPVTVAIAGVGHRHSVVLLGSRALVTRVTPRKVGVPTGCKN